MSRRSIPYAGVVLTFIAVHVALGPMMNLMRVPAAGRNWEGFVSHNMIDRAAHSHFYFSGGGDPFLSGELAFETITGIQSAGVQACAKHYINKYAAISLTYFKH